MADQPRLTPISTATDCRATHDTTRRAQRGTLTATWVDTERCVLRRGHRGPHTARSGATWPLRDRT